MSTILAALYILRWEAAAMAADPAGQKQNSAWQFPVHPVYVWVCECGCKFCCLCAQFLSMHVALELCKQPTQICNIAHPTLSPSLVVILALLYCCSRQHIYVIHQSPCNIWTFKLISMVLALAASVCWPTLKIEVTFMSGTVVSLVWARNIDYD